MTTEILPLIINTVSREYIMPNASCVLQRSCHNVVMKLLSDTKAFFTYRQLYEAALPDGRSRVMSEKQARSNVRCIVKRIRKELASAGIHDAIMVRSNLGYRWVWTGTFRFAGQVPVFRAELSTSAIIRMKRGETLRLVCIEDLSHMPVLGGKMFSLVDVHL